MTDKAATSKTASKSATRKTTRRTTTKKKPAAPKHPLKLNGKEWDKEKVVKIVCRMLATTSMSLRKILNTGVEIDGKHYALPDKSSFLEWIQDDYESKTEDDRLAGIKTISDHYAHARDLQVENFYDDLLEAAGEAKEPALTKEGVPIFDGNGEILMVATREAIAAAKLDSDNKKWVMERMKPKKYGTRINADHTHEAGQSLQDLLMETLKDG